MWGSVVCSRHAPVGISTTRHPRDSFILRALLNIAQSQFILIYSFSADFVYCSANIVSSRLVYKHQTLEPTVPDLRTSLISPFHKTPLCGPALTPLERNDLASFKRRRCRDEKRDRLSRRDQPSLSHTIMPNQSGTGQRAKHVRARTGTHASFVRGKSAQRSLSTRTDDDFDRMVRWPDEGLTTNLGKITETLIRNQSYLSETPCEM